MITEQDIKVYKGASEVFGAAKEVIVNRMEEVIKIIAKIFNKKISSWWFPDAQEGELGDLDRCILYPCCKDGYDEIYFEIGRRCDMETDHWDYSGSFPRKFLFMSDDDIRSEVKTQIKKTEEDAIKKKETQLQRAAEKKMLAASASKKLTKKEKKALGI